MPTRYTAKRDAEFQRQLNELRTRFPDCYIEAWNPEDFKTRNSPNDSVCIVEWLHDDFDANEGTHWDRIERAKTAA